MGYLDDSRRVKAQMAREHQPDIRTAYQPRTREPNPNGSLIWAAWVVLIVGAFAWPLLLVSFILGIILVAKGSVGHGVAIMVLTFIAPLMGLAVLFA